MSILLWIAGALLLIAYRYSQHGDEPMSKVTDIIHASYDYVIGEYTLYIAYNFIII